VLILFACLYVMTVLLYLLYELKIIIIISKPRKCSFIIDYAFFAGCIDPVTLQLTLRLPLAAARFVY